MDPQAAGRSADVAVVGFEGSDDELLLELPPGLVEGHASPNEFVHNPREAATQRFFRHRSLSFLLNLPRASISHDFFRAVTRPEALESLGGGRLWPSAGKRERKANAASGPRQARARRPVKGPPRWQRSGNRALLELDSVADEDGEAGFDNPRQS